MRSRSILLSFHARGCEFSELQLGVASSYSMHARSCDGGFRISILRMGPTGAKPTSEWILVFSILLPLAAVMGDRA